MQWQELLSEAEKASDPAVAEEMFAQAIETAQTKCGPFDPNLARCFMAYASFLESQRRFADAGMRYKLAAAIFKQAKQQGAFSFAQGKVSRMEVLALQEKS